MVMEETQSRRDASALTKHSLAFILDRQPWYHTETTNDRCHHRHRHWYLGEQPQPRPHLQPAQQQQEYRPVSPTLRMRQGTSISPVVRSLAGHDHPPPHHDQQTARKPRSRKRSQSAEEKRRARQCTVDGCTNYTIDRGLCFRHGGGKTCSLDGCERSAKARGLCWRHGGSIRCSVAGCLRGAKSRGLCWSHGGGKRCVRADCDAIVTKRRGVLCDFHLEPF